MKSLEETYVKSFKNDVEFNERKIIYRYLLKLSKKYQKKEKRLGRKIEMFKKLDSELILDKKHLKVNEWKVMRLYYFNVSTLLDEKMNEIDEME